MPKAIEPKGCRVWLDGWRVAVVLRGYKWSRVWIPGRPQMRRVRTPALATQEVEPETAARLLALYEQRAGAH